MKKETFICYSSWSDVLKILDDTTIVIDNGTTGNTIDPTELLYLGGEPIIPKTITYKDNTLFLGNITLKRKSFTTRDVDYVRNNSKVYFDYKAGNFETSSKLIRFFAKSKL